MITFIYSFSGWGTVVLRLAIGAVFVVHGWPKVKSPGGFAQAAWRGYRPAATIQGLVEMVGGLALIGGFWIGRSCVVLGAIMLGALYYKIVKWKVPFMATDKTGWEFDLVLLAGLLTLLLG